MTGPLPSWAQAVQAGAWVDFPGLPRGLVEPDLLLALGRASGPHPRRPALLGSRQRDLVELERLRYWLCGDTVVLVELEDPPSPLAPVELILRLGSPDRTGAGRYRRFGATTTEYVYARRGLAVTVAESYDEPPGFEPFVAAVLLFPASDLRTFTLELGGNDRGGPRF